MQFLVIGLDGAGAAERRTKARQAHIDLGEELRQSGNMWYGAALLDDAGTMNGSMLLMDFTSREELQKWLDKEPYVLQKVWESVEVRSCRVRDPWQFNRPKEFFGGK